nr:response regulator [Desulfobulbaceae bacterium]
MKSLRVLVVDDDRATRRVIKYSLNKMGHSFIHEAPDGDTALAIIDVNPIFDLIISDLNMPRMNGLQLLKAIRALPSYKETPFIMLTAEGTQSHIVEAAQAKVSQYIIKPFTHDSLEEKINILFPEKAP